MSGIPYKECTNASGYQKLIECVAQTKAYEPPQPIIVDADSPMVGVLTGRPCTCHPDDNPPVPCPKKYALSECRKAALKEVK